MNPAKLRHVILHIDYLDSLPQGNDYHQIHADIARWSYDLVPNCKDTELKKSLLFISIKHSIFSYEFEIYNNSLEAFLYLYRSEIVAGYRRLFVSDLHGRQISLKVDWPLGNPPYDIRFIGQCHKMIEKQGGSFEMKAESGVGCPCAIFMDRNTSLSLKQHRHWHLRFADVSKHLQPRYSYPCSIIMDFQNSEELVIKFYDPFMVSNIELNGFVFPLAANFSFPILCHFESMMAHVGFIRKMEQPIAAIPPLSGVINVPEFQSYQGLYFMFPFDSRKIPLIFIHGFMSNTFAWRFIVNHVCPEMLAQYQIGFYQYPTAQALLLTLDDLRDSLKYLAGLYPLEQRHLLYKTAVIGHSMGGVLARLLVTSTETDTILHEQLLKPLLKSMMRSKSIDENELMSLQFHAKTRLEPLVKWPSLDFVKSVVFIACPHKGIISYPFIVQLAKRTLHISPIIKKLTKKLSDSDEFEIANFGSLSKDAPIPRFLASTSLSLSVRGYNIIADSSEVHVKRMFRTEPKSVPNNDGTVSYESAHMEGPNIQEFIVPKSTHIDILYKRETREIVRSILFQNLF